MGEGARGQDCGRMTWRGCLAGLSLLASLYPDTLAARRGEAAAASTSIHLTVTATVLPRQQASVISVETFAMGDAMIVKVSKGVPPYRVQAERGGVARVVRIDPHTFRIVGKKAGESVLDISDSRGNKADCGVNCSFMIRTDGPATPDPRVPPSTRFVPDHASVEETRGRTLRYIPAFQPTRPGAGRPAERSQPPELPEFVEY
jgi:hypothetical protein